MENPDLQTTITGHERISPMPTETIVRVGVLALPGPHTVSVGAIPGYPAVRVSPTWFPTPDFAAKREACIGMRVEVEIV